MQPKIPKLNSRYIPVHGGLGHFDKDMHWWKDTSYFIYPNGLFNLLQFTKENMDSIRQNTKDLFVLVDSGGFQVITGKCNLTWKTSLLKQIELSADKIFAFDKPPVIPKFKGALNQFIPMSDNKTKQLIEENLIVAVEQSKYLKNNYPEELKKFCYIFHGQSKEQFDYNISIIEKHIGLDNYNEYFPGGAVYAIKNNDLLVLSIVARHAYEYFAKKHVYTHFLGLGSFNRMLILIRNNITTFDSSSILQGVRANEFTNPLNVMRNFKLSSYDINNFTARFCTCPVCINVDYKKLQESNPVDVGRNCVLHNLWHVLKINVFLDSIPKNEYTNRVLQYFKIKDNIKRCLEFCDYADEHGFEIAYKKYKYYIKKDVTKQNTLF